MLRIQSKHWSLALPTRLGTAQPIFALLACLLSTGALPAQEDVAETKSNLQIDTTPIVEPAITKTEREHWAYQPIVRHPQPATKNAAWLRTPIDAFILAPIEAKNLQPAPEANRPTLLRRLSFDLRGLPPSPTDLEEFLAPSPTPPLPPSTDDEARGRGGEGEKPDAYERRVDRYLASPAFGERYAQYWLDLARFAESDGYEFDTVRPHAWRYRDWVIAALNADMPYDEFIRQQLAGDEIATTTQSAIRNPQSAIEPDPAAANAKSKKPTAPPPTLAQIPTMFCLAGPDMPDVNDQIERRHNMLNEMAGTVGSALLGLQFGCAQCHNHKYDPISQADFYRLRAVFESAVPAYKRDVPVNVLAAQKEIVPARFWLRGDHRRPGVEVAPAFPRIVSAVSEFGMRNAEFGIESTASHSAFRTPRSALANWLTAPDNPLPARVIANRIWQWHFGRGLHQTPSDFGVMGGSLTHPQLLDYLASELRDTSWSMKRLHRTILSSAVYRQSSNSEFGMRNAESQQNSTASIPHSALPTPHSAADPDNELLAHFPRQRQTGEAIRDALLASAGLLTSERGGPGVMPPLPEELLSTLLKNQWSASKREADHYKRSVYVFARRNLRLPLFEAFDRPDGNASCPSRTRSTTAPQSLLLLNSELSLLAARHLAGRILADKTHASNSQEQIEQLYQITLSRQPTAEESTRMGEFLTKQSQRLTKESRDPKDLALPSPLANAADPYKAAALVDACLAILNSNEFIYVD